jgi:hypothetical protein
MTNAPPPYVPRTPLAPPPVEKKKTLYRRRWFWVVIVLLAAIVGGAVVVGGRGGGAPTKGAAEPTNTIVYSVTGSGSPTVSSITYATVGHGNQNGQVAVSGVSIPWSKTITAPDSLNAFSLTVQNGSVGLSYVTCTISEDGELLITNTSKGPYAIASCDAAGTS